jgi:hypothetical protein
MADILEDLIDLHKQATTERSHHYVAACSLRAIEEIKRLRGALETCRELREYDGKELLRLRKSKGERA